MEVRLVWVGFVGVGGWLGCVGWVELGLGGLRRVGLVY